MDIFLAAMIGLVQSVNGIAWVWVFLNKKWGQSARNRFAIILAILSFAALPVIIWQAVLAHRGGEENRKALLGDQERPPFVSVISLPGNTRFVTTNASDYPAYGIHIELYDDASKSTPLRAFDYPEMAAHLAFLDNKSWSPVGDDEHHFTAEISTRTGLVSEELVLRYAGNNQWMKACRIQQGIHTLEEDVDSAWPRNKSGQVEWK